MALYWKLISASIKSQMEYKFSFIMSTLFLMMLQALDFLLVAAILLKFDHIRGWNIYEVGYLFAIASIVRGLYRIVANEIHNFEKYMVTGEFDQLLIRPVSPLFILFSKTFYVNQIGGVLQGIVILWISLAGMHAAGQPILPALLYLPISVLFGSLIVFALGLTTATIAFWTIRINELLAFTFYGPLQAASFPMHIYPGWIKGVLYTLVPVAFIAYVPALYLFDKGGDVLDLLYGPLVAVVVAYLSLRFWKWGITHYHSSGS